MAAKSFLKSGIGTTLALAILATAVPASAQVFDRDGNGRNMQQREDRGERRGGGGGRMERTETPASRAEMPRAEMPRPQMQRPEPQRRAEGQTFGRDWNNGGAVNRPPQAWRGQTPATPDRGPDRGADRRQDRGQVGNRGPVQQGWDGQRWNGQRVQPQQPSWRNDGRNDGRGNDGRAWNGDRDGRRDNDRGGNWNRDRDGNRDGQWNRDRWRDGDSWRNNNNNNNRWRDGDRWRDGNRGGDYRRWNNDWRRDNRYNWSAWRNHNRNTFRGGYYYAPYRDYSYSRLSIGIRIGSPFYSERYWISDPWAYRLPDVYGPYRWVRYYDDVLLVDTYSGEVVDVIYDFFW